MKNSGSKKLDNLEFSLDEVLSRSDVRTSWQTQWSDLDHIEKLWKVFADGDENSFAQSRFKDYFMPALLAWPVHWRSGVLNEGETEFEEIERQIKTNTFSELLDKLFEEVVAHACTLRSEWVALIPRENLDGQGSGVVNYYFRPFIEQWGDPALTEEGWIVPYQWWRPFLARIEERMGFTQNANHEKREGELLFQSKITDLTMDISKPESRKVMTFRIRVLIDRHPNSEERHCALWPSPV